MISAKEAREISKHAKANPPPPTPTLRRIPSHEEQVNEYLEFLYGDIKKHASNGKDDCGKHQFPSEIEEDVKTVLKSLGFRVHVWKEDAGYCIGDVYWDVISW